MIADYNEIALDLKNIFSLNIPKPKPKELTGWEVHKNIYKITSEISKLGLLQDEISILGKNTTTMADLTKLSQLKQEFKACLLQITEYWIAINHIIHLEETIQIAADACKNLEPEEEKPDFFRFTLIDEISQEMAATDNIAFYIYLLLESYSEFCIAAKNLSLLIVGDESDCFPEMCDVDEEVEDFADEMTDPNFFALCVRDFSFLLLLVKFIAVKFGIDYDQALKEHILKKYK